MNDLRHPNLDRGGRQARFVGRAFGTIGVGTVLLIAIAVNQSAAHWRDNLADDHLFAYFGWCVAHGARPYADVWDNKPPLIWWLNAAAVSVAGAGVESEIALGATALAVALVAFVLIARTLFHRSLTWVAAVTGSVLLTHLRFECGGNRTEMLVVASELLVALGYLRWRSTARGPWLLLAGLAAGAAPLCKQAGVAAALACAVEFTLSLIRLRWRESAAAVRARAVRFLAWFGGGALVVPLIAGAALAAQGALGDAWFAIAEFNRAYFAVGDASWIALPRALRVMAPGLWPLLGPACVVLAGLLMAVVHGRSVRVAPSESPATACSARADGVFLLFVWLVLAVYLATVGPGRREYHLMPALPPLALLMLWPLDRLVGTGGLAATLAGRPSVGVALLVYLAVLAGVAREHGAIVAQCWEQKPSWNALAWHVPPGYEQQADRIRERTRPDERIYVWGWSPGTYRFAVRRAASRFATIEKLAHVGERAAFIRAAILNDLRREPPALFAILPGDLAALRGGHDPELAGWLLPRYDEVETVGGMTLLMRRAAPSGIER